jgi:hypothetical protein
MDSIKFDKLTMSESTSAPSPPSHQPAPPLPKTPTCIRVKNRRKRYLDLNPGYFNSGLELADPLLYDRLVRRFQTAAEREAEGRRKGFSGVLEADLRRSEAKMDALRDENPNPNAVLFTYVRGPNGEIVAEVEDEVPRSKEEGWARWKFEMEMRFVRGEDVDFDYKAVDEDERWDDWEEERRRDLDGYLDGEEPSWLVCEGETLKGETGVQDF